MDTPEIINRLRCLEKQGEDYIWRVAKEAADEIERLSAELRRMRDIHGENGLRDRDLEKIAGKPVNIFDAAVGPDRQFNPDNES